MLSTLREAQKDVNRRLLAGADGGDDPAREQRGAVGVVATVYTVVATCGNNAGFLDGCHRAYYPKARLLRIRSVTATYRPPVDWKTREKSVRNVLIFLSNI